MTSTGQKLTCGCDVCDRVLFLSHGKILLQGDPKTLPQEYGKQNLEELFISIAHEKPGVEDGG